MGASVTLETATVAHALELAPLLREQDAAEVRALGQEPLEALESSILSSEGCVAVRMAGELAAVAGVTVARPTFLGSRRIGCAWLLTGRACSRYRKDFVKLAKVVMPQMHAASGCEELRNWVDSRYTGALSLLERLGFRVLGHAPIGVNGEDFTLVARRQ